ncbi:DUF4007 family protein [Hymenobacter koreensis]|uniref:DUF4007 domain-containing protein n=1 Tax=Hymenobacter koreensis TaxID=1084523 RepID=A0ABP8IZK7_9BACT
MSDLGLSFGRTFPLIRSEVSAVLHACSEGQDVADTMVVNIKIPAAKGYCRRAGLISSDWAPTQFGEQVLSHDPNLVRPETLWLLHYFLSAPHYSTPNFWGDLVVHKLVLGTILNMELTRNKIAEFSSKTVEKEQSFSTLDSAATSFLGTYSKKVSLYELGIFPERKDKSGEYKEQSGSYQMSTPLPIPAAAFACILADYWQANFSNTASIDEEQLTQSDLPKILLLGVDGFNAKLAELADPQRGLVQRQRRFNPPQLLRRWTDAAALWDSLYA